MRVATSFTRATKARSEGWVPCEDRAKFRPRNKSPPLLSNRRPRGIDYHARSSPVHPDRV